jgi:predicted metal-binding membrane protein
MFSVPRLRAPAVTPTSLLAATLALTAGVAWVALLVWQASPWGRFLHHADAGLALPAETLLFVAGWALMIVAMMLPTSIPLVLTFARLVSRRPRPARLLGLLVAGYVAVWTAFGLVAYLGDRLVHAAVDALPWLAAHPQLITAATLAAAGLWQFSPLKYRCLEACRSPLGFVLDRWRGERPEREALALGVAHGAFCVGCCWSLMLVMFAVGLGSLGWMLVLGGVMAVEKNLPQARRLTRPLGVLLVVAAVAAIS